MVSTTTHVVRLGDARPAGLPPDFTDVITADLALRWDCLFPDAVVAPYLVTGGTDARHFTALTPSVYRFAPTRLGLDDLKRVHGTNERLSVAHYAEVVRFYAQLLRNAAELSAAGSAAAGSAPPAGS